MSWDSKHKELASMTQGTGNGIPGRRNSKYSGPVPCLGIRRESVAEVNWKRTMSLGQYAWYNEESVVSSVGKHWGLQKKTNKQKSMKVSHVLWLIPVISPLRRLEAGGWP